MGPPNEPEAAVSMSASDTGSTLKKAVDAAGIFPRNGPDVSARPWGHHASGLTFAAQRKLPKQPVPSLESSCKKYLDALKPLQSTEEQEASVKAVRNFSEGEGPILQAQLKEYDDSHDNYFEHFCYEAFLGDDSPVVLNSNAFCVFSDDPDASRNDQITRATSLVRSALAFSQAIRDDRLQPDDIRGVPQCSNQYWWLFGVARVPGDDGGRLRIDADARHIVVFSRGRIYRLDVLEESPGGIIGEAKLAANLQSIMHDANQISSQENSKTAVGVLTTENQKVWARCRKSLVHEGLENGQSFGSIDSSLFALCLDDSTPKTDSEVCRNMICGTNIVQDGVQVGTCINRWYDKLAIIVCRNGAAGMNFEHTCTDGSVDIRLACDIYSGALSNSEGSVNGHAAQNSFEPTAWRKFEWDIPSEVSAAIQTATEHLQDRISQHQLETLNYKSYGATFIKAAGFSPDAFFQMILQVAYYNTYHQIRSGFEPVVTRQFLHGRTDVVRTTTPEAANFARLYADTSVSAEEKIAAMRKATHRHVELSKTCANGGSHHRHLYVLQQLWKKRRAFLSANDIPVPEKDKETIFTDPGWGKLGTTILMGSNVDNPCLAYAGFGPAAAEGFTVVYAIRKDHIAMSVTSRNGEAEKFRNAIERTLGELRGILEK